MRTLVTSAYRGSLDTTPFKDLLIRGEAGNLLVEIDAEFIYEDLAVWYMRGVFERFGDEHQQELTHTTDGGKLTISWLLDNEFTTHEGLLHLTLVGLSSSGTVVTKAVGDVNVRNDRAMDDAPNIEGNLYEQLMLQLDNAVEDAAASSRSANSAKDAAVTAQGLAEDAQEAAEAAQSAATDAKDDAEAAALHYPHVGTNGNWFVWNVEDAAWTDTGILAEGGRWYSGLLISGTSAVPAVYPTGIEFAHINDIYLNTGGSSVGNVYLCTQAGNPATALWKYITNITGAAAGFGTPVASASQLPENAQPTFAVTLSGPNAAKVMTMSIGVPKGKTGNGLSIKGYYATLAALEAAVPSPEVGDQYGVGATAPYDIYVYDGVSLSWMNNGNLKGDPGDVSSVDGIDPDANGNVALSALRTTSMTLTDADKAATRENIDAECSGNKVTLLSSESTDEQYPSAKCTYDAIMNASMNIHPKFGVSGVGGSSPMLTRLWDSVGKSAAPGTNTVQTESDFDEYAPFNRRKCVGTWTLVNGKATFSPQAYEGDADFAEDGTKGDFVAYDVTPVWWYESADGSVIGVSAGPQSGWQPHKVCLDRDGNIRAHTYLPCYPMALDENGHAVSLPGFFSTFGTYYDQCVNAHTYGGGILGDSVMLEPSAVDHYEYLLMTIEFATQNMQNIMYGALNMVYGNTANYFVKLSASATNSIVATGVIGDALVIGQTIYLSSSYDSTPSDNTAYNQITGIQKCDADGTLNESGTFRLVTFDGTARNVVADSTLIMSRPWKTGACVGAVNGVDAVLGHTGSPGSNSNGKYPCMYRWREHPYGNHCPYAGDLMNVRVDDGNDVYHLEWYHLPDRTTYFPASSSKPDLADLTNPSYGWVKLSTFTPASSYANGFIKERGADEGYPHVKIPTNTVGGSSSSYFCDSASLVHSHVVRAVRRRGHVNNGPNGGPCSVSAAYAPSHRFWAWGAGLFPVQ